MWAMARTTGSGAPSSRSDRLTRIWPSRGGGGVQRKERARGGGGGGGGRGGTKAPVLFLKDWDKIGGHPMEGSTTEVRDQRSGVSSQRSGVSPQCLGLWAGQRCRQQDNQKLKTDH